MVQDLHGKTILITSGPTFAPIDAVRSLTNRSTGRLGSTIAHSLMNRGAHVCLLAGETSWTPSMMYPKEDCSAIDEHRFMTVDQLREGIQNILQMGKVDAVLMAAAVLDYIPVGNLEGKKRSDEDEWIIRLRRGEKIIEKIRDWAPDIYLVGFKLEAKITLEELTERALDLMRRSGARLVVANRVEEIRGEQHVAYLIEKTDDGKCHVSSPLMTREMIADALTDKLIQKLNRIN